LAQRQVLEPCICWKVCSVRSHYTDQTAYSSTHSLSYPRKPQWYSNITFRHSLHGCNAVQSGRWEFS